MGDSPAEDLQSSDEKLRVDLAKINKSDQLYFNICVGMVVFFFAGAFALVISNLNNPMAIKTIFAVTGISFAGLIKQMIALWREKVHTEIAATLAKQLPPQDLKAIVSLLLTNN